MNSLALGLIAIALFVLAYRYLGRWLSAVSTTTGSPYSTSGEGAAEGPWAWLSAFTRSGLPLAIAGAALLAQTPTGAGFVWLVSATVLVAAPYLALAHRPPAALAFVFSVLTAGIALILLSAFLVRAPAVLTAYLVELVFLGVCRGRPRTWVVWTGLTVAVGLATLLGDHWPLSLGGSLQWGFGSSLRPILPAAVLAVPLSMEAAYRGSGSAAEDDVVGVQWALLMFLVLGTFLFWPAPLPFMANQAAPTSPWLLCALPLLVRPRSQAAASTPLQRFGFALVLGGCTLVVFLVTAAAGLRGHTLAGIVPSVVAELGHGHRFITTAAGAAFAMGLRGVLIHQLTDQGEHSFLATRPRFRRLPWLLVLAGAALLEGPLVSRLSLWNAFNLLLVALGLWMGSGGVRPLRGVSVALVVFVAWGLGHDGSAQGGLVATGVAIGAYAVFLAIRRIRSPA